MNGKDKTDQLHILLNKMGYVFSPYRFRVFKNSRVSGRWQEAWWPASMQLSMRFPRPTATNHHQSERTGRSCLMCLICPCVSLQNFGKTIIYSLYITRHLEQTEICIISAHSLNFLSDTTQCLSSGVTLYEKLFSYCTSESPWSFQHSVHF